MGRLLRDASIRTKVLTLVIIVAGVALVLASAALLTTDYYQYRTDIRQNLATQARMVLENSTAAMSFQDPEAAQETLATLSPNEHIRIGCLYNAGGRLFARFTPDRSSEAQCPVISTSRLISVMRLLCMQTPSGYAAYFRPPSAQHRSAA